MGVPALARATTTFQQLEVEIPDIVEQHKIVEIFENFRKKMEINIKINNNLSDLLQTIYQEQFGDGNLITSQGILSDIGSYSKEKVAVSELMSTPTFQRRICCQEKLVQLRLQIFRIRHKPLPAEREIH